MGKKFLKVQGYFQYVNLPLIPTGFQFIRKKSDNLVKIEKRQEILKFFL